MPTFAVDPLDYIRGNEQQRAIASLLEYMSTATGRRFEALASESEPNRITVNDILAVSMLGVNVPARKAIWLLEDGADLVSEKLAAIGPQDIEIWEPSADLTEGGPAWQLWDIVRNQRNGGPQMGAAKTSKLLAAKRPHLIPVQDSAVVRALKHAAREIYWSKWQDGLTGRDGAARRAEVAELRAKVQTGTQLSLLRVLDIVIWMREQGWKSYEHFQHYAPTVTALGAEHAEADHDLFGRYLPER